MSRQVSPLDLSSAELDDAELRHVLERFRDADPTGRRAAHVFRSTFDQLYDGQRTGRYKWDQLFKTEKTHYGTLVEINLRREFKDILEDGEVLDYSVDEIEIDCKYSFRFGGWMIPPEAFGQLLLIATASDEHSEWAMGVVRASQENLRSSSNRDGKTGLNVVGRSRIVWLHRGAELPPNVLLQVDEDTQTQILGQRSGQKRINELFRRITNSRIGRNTIATVAQQDDYMKRVRANGGARTLLAREGLIILGGDYKAQRSIARRLSCVVPQPGEFVSVRVVPASEEDPHYIELEGKLWRVGHPAEWTGIPAPHIPTVVAE